MDRTLNKFDILDIDGSLHICGLLNGGGSLFSLGLLKTFDSLFQVGLLEPAGPLFLIGMLTHHDPLNSSGLLSTHDKIPFSSSPKSFPPQPVSEASAITSFASFVLSWVSRLQLPLAHRTDFRIRLSRNPDMAALRMLAAKAGKFHV